MARKKIDHSGEIHNGWEIIKHEENDHRRVNVRCIHCGASRTSWLNRAQKYVPCECTRKKKKPPKVKIPRAKPADKYFYIATKSDKFEYPIAIADTIEELAEITGASAARIKFVVTPSGARRYAQSPPKGGRTLRYFRVLEEDEDEDDETAVREELPGQVAGMCRVLPEVGGIRQSPGC